MRRVTTWTSLPARALLGVAAHPGGRASTRRLADLARMPAGGRLVDVGCGRGTSALALAAERHLSVWGTDVEPAAVRGARTRARLHPSVWNRATFVTGDAHRLPFTDQLADAVLCECALSTFADPAVALAEMRRVLRPGGRVAISDIAADRVALADQHPAVLAALDRLTHARSLAAWTELLTGAGFAVPHVEARREDALELVRRLRRRLGVAGRVSGVARAALPVVVEAEVAVREGLLGYGLLVGETPS